MPDFHLSSTTYTVADYCASLQRNEVRVNRNYQRSDKVWPPAAQSFLIETILLGYPIPKLSLHQITDIKTRRSVREIIDGQQRTRAIQRFYDNELRLSRTTELDEAAGRSYEELSEVLKQAFLEYPVSADVFTGALPEQIREVFRRINSYTVPLNPEEQRHATFQGNMKWFIYQLCRDFDNYVQEVGTFTQGNLVRMADAKLYSEVVHALEYGVQTTKKQHLDRLYKDYEVSFEQSEEYYRRFCEAMMTVIRLADLHKGPLMKPHIMYSLLLAIMDHLSPINQLRMFLPEREQEAQVDVNRAAPALSELSVALDMEESPKYLDEFVKACGSKTNVKVQREARIRWLCNALKGEIGGGR